MVFRGEFKRTKEDANHNIKYNRAYLILFFIAAYIVVRIAL